ncbi:MAG: Ig-like domain-containing protein [Bacteroidales bacterium]|nr:Ig-like domain-containing protein [Bacteroidales bacterium]
MKKTLLSLVIILAFASFSSAQVPDRAGWWKFDDAADMLKAETGMALALTGTQVSVPGPVAGNLATQISLGSYLTMTHGISANGGGDSVNEYTVQIDFSLPEVSIWHAFFQTNPSNSGDADLFTRASDNTIGTAATGYSANAVTADTWYRMIISVKNSEFFNVYLNGELWLTGTPQDIDGRWALVSDLLIFADDDGDDATINCAELGIWNVALSAAQASELGNATTEPLAMRKGWWKFDDVTDLLKAEIGSPLTLTGSHASVSGPAEGNLATQVPLGSYYSMTHNISANGGGDSVNEYSVLIDFSVPDIGIWHAFIQTNPTNTGDADLFTKASDNTIGTSATGYSTNSIGKDAWYRMIISVKNGEFFNVYLNGDLWLTGTPQDVDGRWALVNELLIFADDDGDDAPINCAELAIWDVALTADEALQLGGFAGNILVSQINVTGTGGANVINTQSGTLQMLAEVLPADATDKTVTWSVTNGTGEGTISTDGLLTAVKNGTVTVTATSNDGSNITGSMEVTISNQAIILVTSITVTSESGATTISTKGGTLQMIATILPENATEKDVTWSVSKVSGDATITTGGLLAAVADGTVTVIATSTDGGNIIGSLGITISNQTTIRERVGWWKFDDATDMVKATIGQPLVLTGTQTSINGPIAGNLATMVPLGSYLDMNHGIAPNGGGSLVNEWSLQIDFSVPMIDTWYAFFQTLDGDADLFVAKTEAPDIGRVPNSIGCGSTRYSEAIISDNTWYRMLVSVQNDVSFRIYIDGELWLDAAPQPLDDRYGLSPILQIFQDDDGDDGDINCSELGIWNVALTEAEAIALGNATTTNGINDLNSSRYNDLGHNYPNPCSTHTTFPYKMQENGNVTFHIFDLAGIEIAQINEGVKSPGEYKLEINSGNLKSGVYTVTMITNERTSVQKMIVLK